MRNYLFSIATHLILLLLLLGLSFTTIKNKPEQEVKQVIMVDFSQQESIKEEVKETKRPAQKAKKQRSTKPSPQKAQNVVAKATKIQKKTLRTSQKPNAESSRVLDEKSSVVKKAIPHKDPQPTPEELAKAEREEQKKQKRSHFASLLSKAKNKTAADNNQPETEEEVSGVTTGASSSSSKNKNIQGVLGNRKVLRSPSITDKSQKKGRVVVKICVGSDGKVLSSKYTMMGSTTSDSYLIGLAEKGAMQYLFSESSNPKECGNVVIEFQLK